MSEFNLEPPIIFVGFAIFFIHFENFDQKIHYWNNEIKQIQKKNKFFDYIETIKNTHRIIKDEFSKNNQTYYGCKGDLFFVRTDVLRKGLLAYQQFPDVTNMMSPTRCH